MKNYKYLYVIQGQERKEVKSYFLDDISREFRELSEDGYLMPHPMDYMGVRFKIIELKTNKLVFSHYSCLDEVTGMYHIEKKIKGYINALKQRIDTCEVVGSYSEEYKKELREEEERLEIFQKHYYNPNSWEEDFDSLFY